jgi:hypothetical protein
MACSKLVKRNLNRYRKVYPYLRKRPAWGFISDVPTYLEAGRIIFNNTNTVEYSFTCKFPGVPTVTATAIDSEGNDSADVNVYIKKVDSLRVTIETSQAFTGAVEFQAIYISGE